MAKIVSLRVGYGSNYTIHCCLSTKSVLLNTVLQRCFSHELELLVHCPMMDQVQALHYIEFSFTTGIRVIRAVYYAIGVV